MASRRRACRDRARCAPDERSRTGLSKHVVGFSRLGDHGEAEAVEPRHEARGYEGGVLTGALRAGWYDVDLNGCDTRNDILFRDLKQVVYKPGSDCKVAKGTLADPYTGTSINFIQGSTSSAVQIDHVVALSAAWRTGAKQWKAELRLFYANDPLVLLAVDGPANNQKSDKDAAVWVVPENPAYRCKYVAKQIAVKTKYELWVTDDEHTAMADVLGGC